MQISEKTIIPLSLENSISFKPKTEKEISYSKNIEINVQVSEEDEQLLKIRDIPRRKSSTGSTTSSKPEDPSELFSCPSSPRNINTQDSNKNGIFFGKDRNCSKNNIFNFYQITEEHIRETFPEYNDYIKSKNYILKQDLYQYIDTPKENKTKDQFNNVSINTPFDNNNKNSINNNNTSYQNMNKITAIPAFIGTFTPNPFSGNKGKFDLPMQYCIGFYPIDGKYIFIF